MYSGLGSGSRVMEKSQMVATHMFDRVHFLHLLTARKNVAKLPVFYLVTSRRNGRGGWKGK